MADEEIDRLRTENKRMRETLIDLESAFSKTSEIPETPFTLHALEAIRRALASHS